MEKKDMMQRYRKFKRAWGMYYAFDTVTGNADGDFRLSILVSSGKLRPLGSPNPNAVKFFSSIELITLLAGREWLDETTKTIGQFWKRKNASRKAFNLNK
jgi:hypothetical protein